MSLLYFILTVTAAIGSANATASRLADVMSKATGYKTQLHSNVTAYDICMYLATGYQYNQVGTDTNITTEAYDDHEQGIARIVSRHVNDEYDNTTEAFNSYNKTQRVTNFDVADCVGVTDDEVISWYFPRTAESTHYDEDLRLDKRWPRKTVCLAPGQGCRASDGRFDIHMCSTYNGAYGTSCGCAEYGRDAAACQTSQQRGVAWHTGHHRYWGAVTALMIEYEGRTGKTGQRLVGFIADDSEY